MSPAISQLHVAVSSKFFHEVKSGRAEIYNEFSLQHELGLYLRSKVTPGLKVQFERPAGFFGLGAATLLKKEIDIAIFTPDVRRKFALELKYPRNGQYPEQMLEACRDIAFLEQLVAGGFAGGVFVMAAEHSPFFRGRETTGIYCYFRLGEPIRGAITKPTGARDEVFAVVGPHAIFWQSAGDRLQFACVTIGEDGDV